jgi:putative Holliday junction resolvase
VFVAVDPGAVRTGVAATDPAQLLASPVATLSASEAVDGVVSLVADRQAVGVIVGLPLHLSGDEGTAAATARSYAGRLASALEAQRAQEAQEAQKAQKAQTEPLEQPEQPVPVYLVDERLTTVSATSALRSAGHDGRSARRVVDRAAAAALLQGVVDAAKARGIDCSAVLDQGMGELVKVGMARDDSGS